MPHTCQTPKHKDHMKYVSFLILLVVACGPLAWRATVSHTLPTRNIARGVIVVAAAIVIVGQLATLAGASPRLSMVLGLLISMAIAWRIP
jgi:hypothetical protein